MVLWIAVIPLLLIGLFLVIAYSRTGSVNKTWSMSRKIAVTTAEDADAVFQRILDIGGVYKVDDRDPERRVIILSSPPTFTTWGFFYPVFLRANADGSTDIAIGVASKVVQFGPLVTRAHKKCAEAIEGLFAIPAARVVNG